MSRIIRHIKDGFLGVFRHFALSFSSISSMTVMLLLMSVFILLSQNINQITKQIEENVALYVQIEHETDQGEIDKLEATIKNIPGILNVTFSDKDTELEVFIANQGEEGEVLFGDFRGEDNPMMDVFIANVSSGVDVKSVSETIGELEGIYKVAYGGDGTQTLIDAMSWTRNAGFVFVIVLSAVAVFLIANTISATIHSRQKEISIMRTVGATNWFIRWPFIIEGMLIGVLGSLIPIGLTVYGYSRFYEMQSTSLGNMFRLVPAQPLIWQVSSVLIIAGALVGAFGSLITVSRRLRWTR